MRPLGAAFPLCVGDGAMAPTASSVEVLGYSVPCACPVPPVPAAAGARVLITVSHTHYRVQSFARLSIIIIVSDFVFIKSSTHEVTSRLV